MMTMHVVEAWAIAASWDGGSVIWPREVISDMLLESEDDVTRVRSPSWGLYLIAGRVLREVVRLEFEGCGDG